MRHSWVRCQWIALLIVKLILFFAPSLSTSSKWCNQKKLPKKNMLIIYCYVKSSWGNNDRCAYYLVNKKRRKLCQKLLWQSECVGVCTGVARCTDWQVQRNLGRGTKLYLSSLHYAFQLLYFIDFIAHIQFVVSFTHTHIYTHLSTCA